MFTPHNMLHVTCHVSRVTCHVSRVTCHVPHVTDKVVKLIGGGSVINGTLSSFRMCGRPDSSSSLYSFETYNPTHPFPAHSRMSLGLFTPPFCATTPIYCDSLQCYTLGYKLHYFSCDPGSNLITQCCC